MISAEMILKAIDIQFNGAADYYGFSYFHYAFDSVDEVETVLKLKARHLGEKFETLIHLLIE
jgi:hypothetical protein